MGQLLRAVSDEFVVDDVLTRLCGLASAALSSDAAGVMAVAGVPGRPGQTRLVYADAVVREPELAQEFIQVGPCRDAVDSLVPVVVPDLSVDSARWPRVAAAGLAARMRSVVAVPLVSRGRSWGVLDLYRRAPGGWAGDELEAAQLLADLAVSYVVIAHDRDRARLAERELTDRYLHDQLTGLPNRILVLDRIAHALAAARREQSATAVMFIDLDQFKAINDTFGHDAGDEVLVEVARRLAAVIRPEDTLARLAGDEFVLLCPGLPHPTSERLGVIVAALAGRLRAALSSPVRVQGAEVEVTASIGVSVTADMPAVRDLLDDADVAMYAAKTRGPGQTVVHDHLFGAARGYGRQLRRELAEALGRDQLRVHYQPITTLDATVTAVEALIRWEHPQHGLMNAVEFIHLAPSACPQLSHWVLREACAQLARWRTELGDRAPAVVFVNLSPPEITDPELLTVLTDRVHAHGLRPGDVGLEIVEGAFTNSEVLTVLEQLTARGHPLAVDDFGTGYSSLSRLVTLPVSYVKIDQRFVTALPAESRSAAMVDAVLVVARHLGVQVIAEGVETAAQHDHLAAAGCTLFQGHHVAPALPGPDITALISRDDADPKTAPGA